MSLTLAARPVTIRAMPLSTGRFRWLALAASVCAPSLCLAQDLEPRRWTHLPVGTNVLGLSYTFTSGDLGFDPVLQIQDARVEMQTAVVGWTRYFALWDRTARIDVVVPLQSGDWDGLVGGLPRSVSRDGLADPVVRLSANLAGAPALSGKEFAEFRAQHREQTSLGAALELHLPLGEYQEDKLINLGQNRFTISPQLGLLHTSGEWSFELTGSAYFFTANDEFFNGNELEQDPLYATQAHVVKLFGQDWWVAAGAAYAWAGESTINGVRKGDDKSNLISGASFGLRLDAAQSLRLGYIRTDTLNDLGSDTDSFVLGWSFRF
jgi:Putative MetA-pathway of phenol degradation